MQKKGKNVEINFVMSTKMKKERIKEQDDFFVVEKFLNPDTQPRIYLRNKGRFPGISQVSQKHYSVDFFADT